MKCRIVALVILFVALTTAATLAQSPPASQSDSLILVATSGTSYHYEISRERTYALPRWDPAKTPEPPLSLGGAKKAAEAWLTSQNRLIKTFSLTGVGFFRFVGDVPLAYCGPVGCWYYRVTFEPVLGDLHLSGDAEITVVVLLDGSIVWPREQASLVAVPGEATDPSGRDADVLTTGPTQKVTPAPDANGVYRLGNGVWSPRPVRMIKPQYTAAATRARLEGTVVLDCVVKKDGTVGDLQIVKSLDAGLDQEAIKAVRQWTFAPGTFRDKPVAVLATCQVEFKLR